jgi:hypothetical protein
MTNEQINIAIAEACGWRELYLNQNSEPWGFNTGLNYSQRIPDYCNDLNAMHEAEKVLTTTEQQNNYYAEIAEITWGCEEIGHRQVVFNQLTATARQRAEAFLKTLGKWEGAK